MYFSFHRLLRECESVPFLRPATVVCAVPDRRCSQTRTRSCFRRRSAATCKNDVTRRIVHAAGYPRHDLRTLLPVGESAFATAAAMHTQAMSSAETHDETHGGLIGLATDHPSSATGATTSPKPEHNKRHGPLHKLASSLRYARTLALSELAQCSFVAVGSVHAHSTHRSCFDQRLNTGLSAPCVPFSDFRGFSVGSWCTFL